MRLTDLADVLRGAGLTVIEVDGWRTRGKELVSVEAIVWHHTATGPAWSDQRVADLLRDGRSDLAGPLSQLGLDRQGRFVVVAAGRANHNGYGTHGNASIGIEAYNSGLGEPWPAAQLDAYDRGTAAMCKAYGIPASRVLGHRETDPRRKIDPAGIDMDAARRRVASLITDRPAPPPPPKGPLMALSDAEQAEILSKVREIHGDTKTSVDHLAKIRQWTNETTELLLGQGKRVAMFRRNITAAVRDAAKG